MYTQPDSAQRLFLFDLAHKEFVAGNEDTIPNMVTRKVAVRQYVFLIMFVALPMIITITLLTYLAGHRVQLFLMVELITALIACAYFVLRRYFRDRTLRRRGQIVYGEVVRHEVLPRYSGIGHSVITRIFYRFITPDNERIVNWIDFEKLGNYLPDGRKYPETGTPIAVLYANDTNHKIL